MKCEFCEYNGNRWDLNLSLEVFCPFCKQQASSRFVEIFNKRNLSYREAILLRDRYEKRYMPLNADVTTSWAEFDLALNEPLSRKIRSLGNNAKDKLA
jgi:hypothetical protein